MKNTKRVITGLAFSGTIALALLTSGGDAYAKSKSGGGNTHNYDTTINITVDPSNDLLLPDLGITWE